MISTKNVCNVLRMVSAGKDPADPGQAPGILSVSRPIEKSYVLYMYYAPEDKAIDFKNISNDLENSAKSDALVQKLESKGEKGITEFSAGYFSWRKVVVVTNKYDQTKKNYIVYSADVDNMGKIIPGKEEITPDTKYPTTDEIKNTFNIFKDGVLNIQTDSPGSYEVYYFNGDPQANIVQRLLAKPEEATRGERYNDFVKKMDQFRIWTGNGLIRPDFRKSRNDGVKGNYYPGGKDAFNEMILSQVKNKKKKTLFKPYEPENPSLGEKVEEKEEKSIFEPVTRSTEPVKGDYLDTPSQGVKMANKKSVRNVMFAYLKDAAYSTVTPGTTTQMQGMPKPGEMVSPMTTDTVKNKREFEKRNKAIEDMKKRMSPTTTGTGTPGKY